ncbi:carbohydrate ABC transporter permease [Amycolatopsis plumensis]|uniref:carbohydrate ABC transporter permease n=1 Tax=Amycolatopsis plumensis TaxID=236508 RepID=UPI0036079852
MTRRSWGWHLLMVLVLVVLLYPVGWLISASFKPAEEVLAGLSLLPVHATGDNYTQVFGGVAGYSVWHYFGNSLVISVGAVIGNVVSCSLAAYAFARLHFRGRGPMFGFLLSTIMLPQHVVLIPQYVIFQKLGLVNTFWPLVLPKFLATDAFFVFLMVQFIRALPGELDEAATIDGCGPVRTFRYVIAPLLRPALITTAIFTFIWTWNDFFSQLIYLNDPASSPCRSRCRSSSTRRASRRSARCSPCRCSPCCRSGCSSSPSSGTWSKAWRPRD